MIYYLITNIGKTTGFLTLLFFLVSSSGCNTQDKILPARDSDAVLYAERFDLRKTDSCTILTITDPWQGANNIIQSHYLVSRKSERTLKIDSSQVIYVPLKSIICMSTTHIAMIKALGEENSIVAVSGSDLIYDSEVSGLLAKGLINDVGYDSGINTELIIRTSPDLMMIYGIGSETEGYTAKIKDIGIKIMYNADYLETDPLGKAEWIKVFGALFGKEKIADSLFMEVAGAYSRIKEQVITKTESRPSVLLGLPFRDTWYISPGNSYISRLIQDAGGIYLWETTFSSLSMPYSIESVYIKSFTADFWLNPGGVKSKPEILSADSRLGSLAPFINNTIYNNNRRMNGRGGNDYWESGALNPHVILKDIASILHPGIFPEHDLVYYKKVD